MNSLKRTLSLTKRGVLNYFQNRPFCVSFEITHSCNARCKHCHRGGMVEEKRATPQQFAERFFELKPVVIQISGGEPLLRKDVEDIIKALKQPDGTPYIVFVTNAALLTAEKYYRLRDIGVDVYSVSLDYPDERHDEFRKIPGLFNKIKNLTAQIDSGKDKAITLNSVVQSNNFREMPKMAEVARDWGVNINFSPYTWLRTQDKSYMLSKEDIPEFKDIITRLLEFKKKYNTVRTTDSFFYDMVEFFETESIPDCRAGERFLVVNPDATLSPCGLIITDYTSWKDLKVGFTANNTCTSCHTCIRSSTEKPMNNLIKGGLQSLFAR
ncbi:MAG: radical SAM protein [Candidatus Latescibacteria bacterium]|nr:radical SAM protein [Candidatus Latescibacterota bacterium]